MPEPASPEMEAELQRLRDMAEQLKGALALLKKQIDASTPSPAVEPPNTGGQQPGAETPSS
jgi:hypothetical protein